MPCVIGYHLVFQDSEAMMRHTHSRSRADTQPQRPREERTLHGNQPPATCQSPRETEGGREAPAAPPTHHALSPEGHTVSNSKGLLEI